MPERDPGVFRPNILFIVADDLNAWIGALGRHPDVQTPAIDALAASGTLFTHAYCPAPYCNASRMSVFTGCLPSTTGVYGNEPYWEASHRRPTFIEMLRLRASFSFAGPLSRSFAQPACTSPIYHGTCRSASSISMIQEGLRYPWSNKMTWRTYRRSPGRGRYLLPITS